MINIKKLSVTLIACLLVAFALTMSVQAADQKTGSAKGKTLKATLQEGSDTVYHIEIEVPKSAGVSTVSFPIWTVANGKDDLVYHNAEQVDETHCALDLDIRTDHYNGDSLTIEAVSKSGGKEQKLDSITFPIKRSEITQYAGHKGYSAQYPENSLASFKNNKWDYAENDIWFTKDNQWVVMHDPTIDRMTNGTGKIQEMTLDQIRQYKIDKGTNLDKCAAEDLVIPTFKEYLEACKSSNSIPVIHIKPEKIPRAAYDNMVKDLKETGFNAKNMVFICFFAEPLKEMEAQFPGVEMMYLAGGEAEKRISTVKDISNNCGLDVNYKTVDADVMRVCKDNDTKLGVWTLPDKELKKFLRLKVDYITLDN